LTASRYANDKTHRAHATTNATGQPGRSAREDVPPTPFVGGQNPPNTERSTGNCPERAPASGSVDGNVVGMEGDRAPRREDARHIRALRTIASPGDREERYARTTTSTGFDFRPDQGRPHSRTGARSFHHSKRDHGPIGGRSGKWRSVPNISSDDFDVLRHYP